MRKEKLEHLFWNRYANSYDNLANCYKPYQNLVQEVCDHIDNYAKGRPLKVLDAGCGTGNYTLELAQRGHQVVGIDSSPSMLAKANLKKPANISGEPPKILSHDLNDPLPFESESFDAIVSVHVLYTLSDGKRFISELRRVVREQAIIVLVNSSNPLSIGAAVGIQWRMTKGISRLKSIFSLVSVGFWNLLISIRERVGTYQLTSGEELRDILLEIGAQNVQVFETYVGSVLAVGQLHKLTNTATGYTDSEIFRHKES